MMLCRSTIKKVIAFLEGSTTGLLGFLLESETRPRMTCQIVHHCKPGLLQLDMNAPFARRSLRQNLYLANTFRGNLYLIEECLQHCQDQFHTPTLLYFSELLN